MVAALRYEYGSFVNAHALIEPTYAPCWQNQDLTEKDADHIAALITDLRERLL